MQLEPIPAVERPTVRGGTIWFIILFWATQFSLLTMQRVLAMPEWEDLSFLAPRLCVTAVGISLSFGILRIFRNFAGRPIRGRMLIALAVAIVGSLLHAAANFTIFGLFMPTTNWEQADFASYLMSIVQWFWSYLALSGLLLALSYSFESADRERRIAQLRAIADAAQLRALRYQLNPHFMFNTLNSVVALMARKSIESAQLMVENLADFLRASLSLDPREDITLDREIELQSLYLAIEAVRFSDRFARQHRHRRRCAPRAGAEPGAAAADRECRQAFGLDQRRAGDADCGREGAGWAPRCLRP